MCARPADTANTATALWSLCRLSPAPDTSLRIKPLSPWRQSTSRTPHSAVRSVLLQFSGQGDGTPRLFLVQTTPTHNTTKHKPLILRTTHSTRGMDMLSDGARRINILLQNYRKDSLYKKLVYLTLQSFL